MNLIYDNKGGISMMVRILSVLPFAVGCICILLLLGSLIGFASGEMEEEIPAIPCVGIDTADCMTGMSESDLEVPTAFFMLDVELDITWDKRDEAWIGIVDASYAGTCPPDDNGLTNCTASQYDFIAGGPDTTGEINHGLSPGDLRFVTGGHAGAATMDTNIITTEWSVSLAFWFEVLLAITGVLLCLSGMHMAFPVQPFFRKRE